MENISDSQATGQKNTIHLRGMWDLSSLTRDQTWALVSESTESYPLDDWGSPDDHVFHIYTL